LFGQKLKGRFTLIRIRSRDEEGEDENRWLLIKSADEFEFKENLTITRPESVLNKITSEDLENIEKGEGRDNTIFASQQQQQVEEEREFPTKVKPMLSTLVDEPFNSKDWVFEIKWDGVSSILFLCKTKEILEFQSGNGKLITHRYPELVRDLRSPPILSSSSHSAKSVKNQQF
jgi:bifunctional non-homologous end joining protein LigD